MCMVGTVRTYSFNNFGPLTVFVRRNSHVSYLDNSTWMFKNRKINTYKGLT